MAKEFYIPIIKGLQGKLEPFTSRLWDSEAEAIAFCEERNRQCEGVLLISKADIEKMFVRAFDFNTEQGFVEWYEIKLDHGIW